MLEEYGTLLLVVNLGSLQLVARMLEDLGTLRLVEGPESLQLVAWDFGTLQVGLLVKLVAMNLNFGENSFCFGAVPMSCLSCVTPNTISLPYLNSSCYHVSQPSVEGGIFPSHSGLGGFSRPLALFRPL